MDKVEYLYHYTNVDALALILKNRTIRFNSLDKMDDLQENKTADLINAGQLCYISSWTDDVEESIPMWKMYASLEHGVRIKLPINPFVIYENRPEDLMGVFHGKIIDERGGKPYPTIIPLKEMIMKKFLSREALSMQLLHQVEYTNDKGKLEPRIMSQEGDKTHIALNQLGKHKNTRWKFQSEWRYIFYGMRFDFNKDLTQLHIDFIRDLQDLIDGKMVQPFPYYDMKISAKAFEDMEITVSPCINKGAKLIVKDLIEKYNPKARLIPSDLDGLL